MENKVTYGASGSWSITGENQAKVFEVKNKIESILQAADNSDCRMTTFQGGACRYEDLPPRVDKK